MTVATTTTTMITATTPWLCRRCARPQSELVRIDAERAAIAARQDAQQRGVIEQLLKERELLTAAQRERLAQQLLAQPAGPSGFERLHRD